MVGLGADFGVQHQFQAYGLIGSGSYGHFRMRFEMSACEIFTGPSIINFQKNVPKRDKLP